MICVTIGRGRHSSLVEEWQAAADAGVGMVELRIDCLRREPDMKRVLSKRPTPFIFTLRRGVDGGLWRGTEERRQAILREAIALGVDYVDLEMDVASKIRRFGKTKRIVSYHNFKETPSEIEQIAEQCDEMDADVVKIATLAPTVADASRVLKLGTKAQVPTITIGMGPLGVFTRILGARFTAPFTYAGFNPERTFAPGMLNFRTLQLDYFYDSIDRETEVFAVVGDPIEQSLSPTVHNMGFRFLGMNRIMVPLRIPEGTLPESLKALEWLDIKGFSVTIPHKEPLVALLDHKDATVDRTGACNTLIIRDGKKLGFNTDYRAAIDSLEDALGGRVSEGEDSPLREKQVLILGAGGVARVIAHGLAKRGAGVTITNRHDDRAARLAEEIGCRTINWGQRAGTLDQIVINCTPVGMHPHVDDSPLPPAAFTRPGMIVFDTIYHPENTMMLKMVRERHGQTISGVDMFLNQAGEQFRLYTGEAPPLQAMREALKRKLAPTRE